MKSRNLRLPSFHIFLSSYFLLIYITIIAGIAGCSTYRWKAFTFTKEEIVPVDEWEIVAQLIAYWGAKNVDQEKFEKASEYFLEIRMDNLVEKVEKLPLDNLHDIRIDSVILSYRDVTQTYVGQDSFEANEANKRYFDEDGKFIGRLIVGRDHYKVGEIPQGVNEVVVVIYLTTRNSIDGEQSFVRRLKLKYYENSSKWPKFLEGK